MSEPTDNPAETKPAETKPEDSKPEDSKPADKPADAPAATAPSAPAATATAPAPAPSAGAPPKTLAASLPIDWKSLVPSTVSDVALDVLKWIVFSAAVMNWYAIDHGISVTRNIAIGGAFAGLILTIAWKIAWKAYLAIVEVFGKRALGITYAIGGVVAFALIAKFALASGTVHESKQVRSLIVILGGAVFLYPAILGAITAVTGSTPEAANPLGVPLDPRWFETLWILFAKEVKSFFSTTIPYVVCFVFLFLNGYLFFALLGYYTQPGAGELPPPTRIFFDNIVWWVSLWFTFPGITMRLVAEERRMGTLESLLTAPVTDIQVILAKFLGAMAFFSVLVAMTFVYLLMLSQHSREWDWGPIFSGYLAIFLLAGFGIAVGTFWSTLTENQLIAFILAFVTLFFLFFSSLLEQFVRDDFALMGKTILTVDQIKAIAKHVSIHNHYGELLRGVVSTKAIAFFLSGTLLALFGAVRGLETQKWK